VKVCYCLTTEGRDSHAAATYISVRSVRRLHRQARIVLLLDVVSASALERNRHPLLAHVDEVMTVRAPAGPPAIRNRYMKTQQRQLLTGDFLYLDADTIVIRRLDELFAVSAPFAAAANHNRAVVSMSDSMLAGDLAIFSANGWNVPNQTYVNGGVLLFRDVPSTHAFAELWHRKWSDSSSKGPHFDQPALNSALCDSGLAYALLPDRFNAQVQIRPTVASGAHIWHIYTSMPGTLAPATGFDVLLDQFLARGTLDEMALDRFCRQPDPWLRRSLLDGVVVRSMLRRSHSLPVNAFERAWLAGNRRTAMRRLASEVKSGLRKRLTRTGVSLLPSA
jgi:hypothetical protein